MNCYLLTTTANSKLRLKVCHIHMWACQTIYTIDCKEVSIPTDTKNWGNCVRSACTLCVCLYIVQLCVGVDSRRRRTAEDLFPLKDEMIFRLGIDVDEIFVNKEAPPSDVNTISSSSQSSHSHKSHPSAAYSLPKLPTIDSILYILHVRFGRNVLQYFLPAQIGRNIFTHKSRTTCVLYNINAIQYMQVSQFKWTIWCIQKLYILT